jgi:hypothetical protein
MGGDGEVVVGMARIDEANVEESEDGPGGDEGGETPVEPPAENSPDE